MRVWRALLGSVGLVVLGVGLGAGIGVREVAGQEVAGQDAGRPDAAGQSSGQEPDAPTMTLHAYTDLVQMPVLVLDSQRERVPRVDVTQFRLALNDGKPFRPTHVRLEGDDPIELAILIDGDRRRNELLSAMAKGVASLMTESLRPEDHAVVYALDCGGIRHSLRLPPEQRQIEQAVSLLMVHKPMTGDAKQDAKACKAPPHLWSAMAYAVRELANAPGRRVLLTVSDGQDGGSPVQWQALRSLATADAVTIFGISVAEPPSAHLSEPEDHLTPLCELSGGLRFRSSPGEVPAKLREFVRILRERYILDFPRPRRSQAGVVGVEVTLGKSRVFIRPSGVSFPIADELLMADPNAVPSDPSRTPEIGSRRVVKSQ